MPWDVLRLIYWYCLERSRVLINSGLPRDIQEIIEARVRLASELLSSFVTHLLGMGKSSFSKKHRVKRMQVCHKCARWNCDTWCKNLGYVLINREDKIWYIKNGLSKESFNDIYQTLEMHPSRDVHRVLLDLFWLFQDEKERYRPKDLTINDAICWCFFKVEGKVDPWVVKSNRVQVSHDLCSYQFPFALKKRDVSFNLYFDHPSLPFHNLFYVFTKK